MEKRKKIRKSRKKPIKKRFRGDTLKTGGILSFLPLLLPLIGKAFLSGTVSGTTGFGAKNALREWG